jgi:KDO2-lipid IV(A) lauroyltransferase
MTLKDFILLLYLYPGRWLSWLPLSVLDLLRRSAEPLFQIVSRRHIETLAQDLSASFGDRMPPPAARVVARKFIAAAVQRAIDDLVLERRRQRVAPKSFSGREHLDTALAAGRGVVLAGLHWQSGRVAMRYLRDAGYSVLTLRDAEPPNVGSGALGHRFLAPRYQSFLRSLQGEVVYNQDPNFPFQMLAHLRRGGIVCIACDPSDAEHTIYVPFLGRPRRFPVGALYLARAAKFPILPWFARGGSTALELEIDSPISLDYRLPFDEFCQTHLPALVGALDAKVRAHPEEWELWLRI